MNRTRVRFITTPDLHRRGVILVLTGAMLWSMGGLLLHTLYNSGKTTGQ